MAFAKQGYHIFLEKPMAVSDGVAELHQHISSLFFNFTNLFLLFSYYNYHDDDYDNN